jgi:uncharacterized protein (TIGR02147 family)
LLMLRMTGDPILKYVEKPIIEKTWVFEFLDYREYLRTAYQVRKKENPHFSYRFIAGKIGTDSGTFARILSGKRNLDVNLAAAITRVLNHTEHEREYFETLVLFCQAKSPAEKNLYLEKLLRLRGTKVKTLDEEQYEFFRKWYYVAIRELLNFYPYDGNAQKLAKTLRPAISSQEAKDAVKLLLEIGLVETDASGKYRLTEKLLTTGDNIRSLFVHNLQASMAELGSRALISVRPQERDFSGLTLSLSPKGFEDIKEMLKTFRRDVLQRARKEEDVNAVYQINFQFFPLSQTQLPAIP